MGLQLTTTRLTELFDRLRGRRVAVIGDLMLDRYLHGGVQRISPEAPIPVVRVESESARPGGAANVAWNLLRLGAAPSLVGLCGADAHAATLKATLREFGIPAAGVIAARERATVVKTRVIARQQQLIRIDRETPAPQLALSRAAENRLIAAARRALKNAEAVVISDYVKGTLTARLIAAVLADAKRRRLPVLVDSKDNRVEQYRGADWIKPNRNEAARVVGFELRTDADFARAAAIFFERTGARVVAITRSSKGISLFQRAGKAIRRYDCPTHALEVADVTGAGDTAMAVMALMAAIGAPPHETIDLANLASGVTVSHMGSHAPTPREILDLFAQHTVTDEGHKLVSRAEAARLVKQYRAQGKKIAFTNGCFDIFHAGHVQTLQHARSQGDLLIVAINSDASVRRQGKAPDRPLVEQFARAMVLASLSCVDHVIIYDEDTPIPLLKLLRPDILIKGGDYTKKQVVGWQIVESYGGRVVVAPMVDGYSTTRLVAKIRNGSDA